MIISRRWAIAMIAGIVAVSFAVAGYFYSQMPEMMASHWNVRGQVDGYMPRSWGLFLMPLLSLVLAGLLLLLPSIDPLKANVKKFQTHYHLFVILVLAFLLYLYVLTIVWNLGARFNMGASCKKRCRGGFLSAGGYDGLL